MAVGSQGVSESRGTDERPSASFRTDVQGLRGVAVLLVVIFHAGVGLPGGFVGVDVFFVISGYVITRLLVTELEMTDRVSFSSFYARRARRLLPLLALTLVVTTVAGLLFLGPRAPTAATAKTAVAASLFNANTVLAQQPSGYFELEPTENALLHTWSLSVEEQFYLAFPLLLLLLWRMAKRFAPTRSARHLTAALGAGVAAISFGLMWVIGSGGGESLLRSVGFRSPESFAFYAAPTRAWEFFAGALVALVLERRLDQAPRRVLEMVGAVGAGLIVFAALAFDGSVAFTASHAVVPVAGTVLLLLPGMVGGTTTSAILGTPSLVKLGNLSYAWYLLHWPLIVFAAAMWSSPWAGPAAALASLGLAVVAQAVVEDRYRFDRRLVGRRAVAFAAVCILIPVVVGVGVRAAESRLPVAADFVSASRHHIDHVNGCDSGAPWATVTDPAGGCAWPATNAAGSMALIGDSHAGHISESVIAAGGQLGLDVTIVTMSGCPFLVGVVLKGEEDDCPAFIERTLDGLARDHRDIVVLAVAGPLRLESPTPLSELGGPWEADPRTKAQIWQRGLERTVDRLTGNGTDVLLVHDVPYYTSSPQTCSRLQAYISKCEAVIDVDQALAHRQRAFDAEVQVLRGRPEVRSIDLIDSLCPHGRCSNIVDGQWSYRDEHHLSVMGAEMVAPRFAEALAPFVSAVPTA